MKREPTPNAGKMIDFIAGTVALLDQAGAGAGVAGAGAGVHCGRVNRLGIDVGEACHCSHIFSASLKIRLAFLLRHRHTVLWPYSQASGGVVKKTSSGIPPVPISTPGEVLKLSAKVFNPVKAPLLRPLLTSMGTTLPPCRSTKSTS
jgi:hypothetical protein